MTSPENEGIREKSQEGKEILSVLLGKNPSSILHCSRNLNKVYSYTFCVVCYTWKTQSGWMKHWHQSQHNWEQTWRSRGPEGRGIHEQSLPFSLSLSWGFSEIWGKALGQKTKYSARVGSRELITSRTEGSRRPMWYLNYIYKHILFGFLQHLTWDRIKKESLFHGLRFKFVWFYDFCIK